MLKKITILAVILLVGGIALTLYLPEFKPAVTNDVGQTIDAPDYHIDQSSLKKPLLMADTRLTTPLPANSLYGLRLGLFSQLQQAITASTVHQLAIKLTIVKATDPYRDWYLVINGPYATQALASQKQQWLQSNEISATLIRWPVTSNEEK